MAEFENAVSRSASTKDEHTPTVSIGMPVYNGAKYIRVALDSLLAQTFTDFKLVISDNASTDETQAICEEYARRDSRIRYVRQSENKGALANFQFVLNEARGKYFMWAASDDRWDSNWIEQLQDALEKTGGGAVFGQVIPVGENSQPIFHVATGRSFKFNGTRLIRKVRFFLAYEGEGKANLFYSLFRKCVLKDLSLLGYTHDYHVIFDLLHTTEINSVYGVSLYKRIHAESMGEVQNELDSIFLKLIGRLIHPIEPQVLSGYFRLAFGVEKLVLLITLPFKYMLAYKYFFKLVTKNYWSR